MDLENAKKVFESYVSTFDQNDKDIKLKKEHSYKVMDIAQSLAKRKKLSKEEIEIATLIGLIHDIGRFYQIEQTHSYNDKKLDHSVYGVKYLFEENHIRDFINHSDYDEIIKKAVLYHNDYSLPNNLSEKEELFCKFIRDADKIDIFRVYAKYNKFYYYKDEVSKKVQSVFYSGQPIKLEDKNKKSDSLFIVLAFLNDINFPESYDLLRETNNFNNFIEKSVEVEETSKEEWENLVQYCHKIIEGRDKNVR